MSLSDNPIVTFIDDLGNTVETAQTEVQAVKGYMIITVALLLYIAIKVK